MKAKLFKKSTIDKEFTVSLTAELGNNTIVTLDGIESTLTATTSDIDATNVNFTISGGVNNTEYLITIIVTDSIGREIIVNYILTISDIITDSIDLIGSKSLNYYGSVLYSNDYFGTDLRNLDWNEHSHQQKLKSLILASKRIDRLNFVGDKTTSTQPQEFPRDQSDLVPDDIVYATYEEALALLQNDSNGTDTDLSVLSEGLGTARVTYDRAFITDSQGSGISSELCWEYLKPYLRNATEIQLSRV